MLKYMAIEPMRNREKALHYFCLLGAVSTVALPIVPLFFGNKYIDGVRQYAIFYAVAFFVIIALWAFGIELRHLAPAGARSVRDLSSPKNEVTAGILI